MNLLQMSVSGAVMIIAVIVVRALTVNRLPKKIFVLLWGVVLLRLAVPFSVPSTWSAYTFVSRNAPIQEAMADVPGNAMIFPMEEVQMNTNPAPVEKEVNNGHGVTEWKALWLAGTALCMIFFAVSYLRCYLEFRTSLPVRNAYILGWMKEHSLKRPIRVRQSDRIAAPLTYGILKPVILMPKKTEWNNTQQLQYILLHEYMHIRHFDMVWKLTAAFVLCIHWFNPLVWAMYILFNRDIELSCDESVVRRFGQTSKSTYARTLLSMEEKRSTLMPLCNNFSKNAIEERITAIMKTRKVTLGIVLFSIALVVSVVVLFATSAKAKEEQILFVMGRLYVSTGEDVSDMVAREAEASVLDSPHIGFIASALTDKERPEEELQSNFGYIGSEVIFNGSGIAVNMDGKWIQFETWGNDSMSAADGETPSVVQDAADLIQILDNPEFAGERPAGNVREKTAVISCMLEGMLEEMPATLYVGDGFSIYIPDDGWQIYDKAPQSPYLISAVYSPDISLGVARYTDKALADVVADMTTEGYSYDEYSGKLQKFEGEGEGQLLLEARVYGQDNDVWVVSTGFPAAYEWGSRLDAIADTFAITVDD